jgi:hypothetical protein
LLALSEVTKSSAARIGPTVWEEEGPIPIENRSKAETYAVTVRAYGPVQFGARVKHLSVSGL